MSIVTAWVKPAVGEDRRGGGVGAGQAGAKQVGGGVRRAVVDDDHVEAVGGNAVEDVVERAGVVVRRRDDARPKGGVAHG